jgi:hypothetical protein
MGPIVGRRSAPGARAARAAAGRVAAMVRMAWAEKARVKSDARGET